MDVPVIELTDVMKSFGPVDVLKGVDFKAYAGKVTALVGDNGAGKSTLIKGLAGVQPYDSGVIRFDGKPCSCTPPARRPPSASRSCTRTSRCARTSTSSRTCSWAARRLTTGMFDEACHGARGLAHAAVAVGAHREVGAPEGLVAVGRAAPDRRDRPLGAAEGQARHPRRADRRPRRRADRAGAQPGAAAGRLRRRASIIISHNLADVFEVADDIACSTSARWSPTSRPRKTTRDDVVGYITGTKT